jgi:malonyl-CoA/methylmalonyl-CoA synthetase
VRGDSQVFTQLQIGAREPQRVFLRLPHGATLTYGQLQHQSAQLANLLGAAGIAPGDRVAVQVEKSATAVVLYLAVLRAGAVYLPLNTAYTLAELEYFIGDARPALLVCDPAATGALEPLARRLGVSVVHTLGADGRSGTLAAAAAEQAVEFTDVARERGDLAAILYTSGTTGRSKGAMLTHGNLLSNALVLRDYWRFTGRDVLLHALPIYHIHGLFVAINVTLAAGAAMIFLPRFEPTLIFNQLPQATVMMGVPTFYVRLLQDARLNAAATGHMRLFICGSAPLLTETHRAWSARTGYDILERYGMTETGMIASNPYDGERLAGTVGFALPGVSVRIADLESGHELPADQIGMIEVAGPNVFAGYWDQPEKTRAEFHGSFFITGDLGCRDARGYLRIVGRGKDLIISGGYNVYPKEVESEIDALPGVEESAVIGVAHPDLGEGVTALIVAPRRSAELTPQAVQAALRQRLAAYKCPKHVAFVAELPRNTMGKVQKNALRASYANLYQPAGQTGAAPEDTRT